MRIVYFGSSEFGIPCLNAIYQSEHELVGVFTQPARPAGRHRSNPQPTPVAEWCQLRQIQCIEADNINAPDMQKTVEDCNADLLVVIAFGQKVSQHVIAKQRYGAVNVHASLLPKYRGAAPIHWAIMNGETETGVSIITLADRMDAGFVLAQNKTPIRPDDTVQDVHDRLAQIAVPVLMNTIDRFTDNSVVYIEQDETLVTMAPKLKKDSGFIDWNKPAGQIFNTIRALWPWPAAQSVYVCSKTGRSWRTAVAKAVAVDRPCQPGDVVGMLDENLNVICGQGALRLIELRPAGSHLMDFDAFVNGHQSTPGDLFISAEKAMSGPFK